MTDQANKLRVHRKLDLDKAMMLSFIFSIALLLVAILAVVFEGPGILPNQDVWFLVPLTGGALAGLAVFIIAAIEVIRG